MTLGSRRLRSLLFAPAVRPDLLAKLPRTGADGVVIDCEDATPPGRKADGRATARTLAASISGQGTHVLVRVNAVASEWFAADIAEGLGEGLAGIIVPKLERVTEVDAVADALDAAGLDLPILAGLETALGVADARPVLAHPRVAAAYFGAEDFIADMGGVRTSGNAEVQVARSLVALAGRLAGVPVLDQVVLDYGDDESFHREAAEARALGYRGKLCIHPGQVALANAAFTPSEEEVTRARHLLDAYAAAQAAGEGVIAVDGQMVDEVLAAQARTVLASAGDVADPHGHER